MLGTVVWDLGVVYETFLVAFGKLVLTCSRLLVSGADVFVLPPLNLPFPVHQVRPSLPSSTG